jgi:hypothetical protein
MLMWKPETGHLIVGHSEWARMARQTRGKYMANIWQIPDKQICHTRGFGGGCPYPVTKAADRRVTQPMARRDCVTRASHDVFLVTLM